LVHGQITHILDPGDVGARKLWVTGHSLGGALAVIAAAEFEGVFPVTGLHTFGQPRVGFSAFRDFMNAHYAGRFFRFVNDDDIVPRVPPGYSHVGTLMHFDSHGNLQAASRSLEAASAADTEPPEMTEAEFQAMKDQVRELEAAVGNLEVGEPDVATRGFGLEEPAAASRGLFPSVRDHSLVRYIAAVQRQLNQPV
jgi:hypothetical protein